jgi:acyl carrier protein phosphodiesterase
MNWLAHLRLAAADAPLVRIGNLAGDFVRGVDVGALHPELRRGIEQHRAVDRFVDAHPVFLRGRERFAPALRRFAGVALDVFFDHFLARDWHVHGDGRPLERFVADVRDELRAFHTELPPELLAVYEQLLRRGWLTSYTTIDGIDAVLRAMAKRRPRAAPLVGAAAELRRDYDAFAGDFAELWPELMAQHGR